MGLDASQHALQPPVLTDTLRNLCAGAVVSVKRERDVLVELRPVGREGCPKAVEGRDGLTNRILFRFQHKRWHGADQHGLSNTLAAVTAEIARDLATAGGMPNNDGIVEIERFE